MGAIWQKNETTAAKRRVFLRVFAPDGAASLWRGASFVARQFLGQSSSTLIAATGTMTNCRKRTTHTAFTFTADAGTDVCTATAHGRETGDGASTASSTTTLPGGLAVSTDYYFIKLTDNTFKLATSPANAYLGTAIDITDAGTGTHTLTAGGTHERGLDGEFEYEATQTETNFDGSEALAVADDDRRVVTADAGTDALTLTAHELRTGVMVFFTTSNTLPAPLAVDTAYWAVRTSSGAFKLATSFANALAGTTIDITDTGTGVHYLEPTMLRAVSTVAMASEASSVLATVIEGAYTAEDVLRILLRTAAANFSISGTLYTFRDIADSKNSHHGTITVSGRSSAAIDDAT